MSKANVPVLRWSLNDVRIVVVVLVRNITG